MEESRLEVSFDGPFDVPFDVPGGDTGVSGLGIKRTPDGGGLGTEETERGGDTVGRGTGSAGRGTEEALDVRARTMLE